MAYPAIVFDNGNHCRASAAPSASALSTAGMTYEFSEYKMSYIYISWASGPSLYILGIGGWDLWR